MASFITFLPIHILLRLENVLCLLPALAPMYIGLLLDNPVTDTPLKLTSVFVCNLYCGLSNPIYEKGPIPNVSSTEEYINSLKINQLPIDGDEKLTKKEQYNEIILNGLRLKEGINLSELKSYNTFINKSHLEKINKKWDCLRITDSNIKLVDKGFLFVDEVSSDIFY